MGLPELLANMRLRHMCLYTGKMGEETRDLAPFLVALEPDHKLTRMLMTEGDGMQHLWARDYGVFVVSPLGFDALYAHFRKFTSVLDETGENRLYLRFWSNAVMRAFAQHRAPDALISDLLAPCTLIFRDLHRVDGPAVIALSQEAPA